MLKSNKINLKKLISIFSVVIAVNFTVISQSNEDDEVENLLEEETSEENEKSAVDAALQKNFVILEPVRKHELNPQITSYSNDSQVLTGLYEGLFSYNPVTLEPQYAIAKDYKTSRDKKRITFYLREDAYFSNGEQITAQSVRDSWIQLLSTPDAPYSSLFDIVRGAKEFRTGDRPQEDVGIVVVSDFVLSVYLNSPANYFPRILCLAAFSVVHRNPTIYSGPFILYDQEDGLLILKKNPYYWDYKNTYLEQITFVQSDDADDNTFMFNCGTVDWVTSNVDTARILDNSAMQLNPQFGTSYFFFKNSKKKSNRISKSSIVLEGGTVLNPWDYQEFRNAVLEVFPWTEIRKGSYVDATTFVYPLSGYPTVDGFDYTDEVEGKTKIQAAKEKFGVPENQTLILEMEISEYTLSEEKIALISDALAKIGVQLIVNIKSVYSYLAGVKNSDADMFSYSWIGDFADPLAFLTLFDGTSTLNDSGWKNEEFDRLLEMAAKGTDLERYQFLAQAESLLLDSGMVLPIYHPVSFNLIDLKEVGGWSVNAFDMHPLKYLYKKVEQINYPNVVKK